MLEVSNFHRLTSKEFGENFKFWKWKYTFFAKTVGNALEISELKHKEN